MPLYQKSSGTSRSSRISPNNRPKRYRGQHVTSVVSRKKLVKWAWLYDSRCVTTRINLIINDIRNLVSGNIVSGQMSPEMVAAADH